MALTFRLAGLCVAAFALAGCAVPPLDPTTELKGAGPGVDGWSLNEVRVSIPEAMPVSEDPDIRYPSPDTLVWWGDPPGDRKAQVAALLADAAREGAAPAMTGARPVDLTISVIQFHAMTPKALATDINLGVHEMRFDLGVRDAATGEMLAFESDVSADMRAQSGPDALIAEEEGRGQKPQIHARIRAVIRRWLGG
ncbi:MAG: DUF6778 family protein [Pikeienuella sp.]|uniref:DUF6778 family protein n=1 Tax=Pikeienuella sp. TaxID=2831957 RepID=UPI00391AC277